MVFRTVHLFVSPIYTHENIYTGGNGTIRSPFSNPPPIIYRINTEPVLFDSEVIRAQDGSYFGAMAGFQGVGCYYAYAVSADEEDLELWYHC